MGRRNDARDDTAGAHAQEAGHAVYDRRWTGDLHSSIRCAALLFGMLLLIDWGSGHRTWWRTALWLALSVLLFLVLHPRRVSAGEGWLASRGLIGTQRVRTDMLVSLRSLEGVSQRLVLRDAFGDRVELDPQVLVNNPDLWYRLHEDVRKSAELGSLLCGATALRRIQERIERETAHTVFKMSGME
ncbi:hypothetical protein MBT84_37050 [Streptomyces sp. MBT84]|uniref:hypothetical protein n=1 Tax=unclassified Streptomyces TaxID=2593676 RepID=UPI001D258B1A|nr:hypothetical protein [Streptomyces sp. MBT84]MBW8705222.1 hypothetical protein [Streptomyces sp. MBT84]